MNVKIIIAAMFLCLSANAQKTAKSGKEIYEGRCAKCHGKDGTKGLWGAINLKGSRIGDTEITTIISNGRRIMPSWKKRLTEKEIVLVTTYIKTLRK